MSDIPPDTPDDVRREIIELYSSSTWRRARAVNTLGDMGDEAKMAVPFLIGMLNDHTRVKYEVEDEQIVSSISNEAVISLSKISDPRAVPPLFNAFMDKDDSDREGKREAIINMGENAIEPLISILKGDDFLSRLIAAKLLGEISDERAVSPLIIALEDDYYTVRLNAAVALGKFRDARAVSPLINLLDDKYEIIRWEAATSLGEIADIRAVIPLLYMINYKGFMVQNRFVDALKKIGDVPVMLLVDVLKGGDKMIEWVPRTVKVPIGGTIDNNWYKRENAVKLLGKLGNPLAVETLIETLDDEDEDVLKNALRALGEIKDPRAVLPLISRLKDKRGFVRSIAASSLGNIPDAHAVMPLIDALSDTDNKVRENAMRALITITGENFRDNKAKWLEWWDKQ